MSARHGKSSHTATATNTITSEATTMPASARFLSLVGIHTFDGRGGGRRTHTPSYLRTHVRDTDTVDIPRRHLSAAPTRPVGA